MEINTEYNDKIFGEEINDQHHKIASLFLLHCVFTLCVL